MAQAADVGVRRSSTASFAEGLFVTFEVVTITLFLIFLQKVATKWGTNIPDVEVRLIFVKS